MHMDKTNTLKNTITRHFLIVATISVFVASFSSPVSANSFEDDVENPQSGSLGLGGVVEGEPPEQSASINSPTAGTGFTDSTVTVSGTCQPELIVEIYKNDTFAGSAICEDNGTFDIEIALFRGQNELQARVRDLLGQSGPDSDTVTVDFDPQVTTSDRDIAQQLLLTSNVSFRGASPGSEITFPMQISGGQGPYAVGINWGDGNDDVISRSDTGSFSASHAFDRPGVYRVVARAVDENDQASFLQLTAVVDGEVDGSFVEDREPTRIQTDYILWPIYVLAVIVPISFWLGSRHMRRKYE